MQQVKKKSSGVYPDTLFWSTSDIQVLEWEKRKRENIKIVILRNLSGKVLHHGQQDILPVFSCF